MSIKGLTEKRRMPRLGKFHLGIKKTVTKDNREITYPVATDYIVPPEDLISILGEKPKELDIMFPVEDPDKFASQFYKCYSSYRGLVCRGNGETCMRMVDAATGDFAHRDTKEVVMKEAKCDGMDCPMYQAKKCKEVMNLQFLLPNIPGLGVWQLDTGSYHSIVTVNSAIELIKNVCGRVSMIPLKLTLEPREVVVDGKKKNVHVLNIRANVTLAEIQRVAALPASQVMLPAPDEERPVGICGTIEEGPVEETPDEIEESGAKTHLSDEEISEMWGLGNHKSADKPQDAKPVEKVEQCPQPQEPYIDMGWLQEKLTELKWKGVGTYLKDKYGVTGKTISEAVSKLNKEQSAEFTEEIQTRLGTK
jgi:hypothetical protein